jgi:hypothetical protein
MSNKMNKLITVHNLNGAEAITTTVERVIQELIALGELDAIIQELIKCGALDPVINITNIMKVMSVARTLKDDAGYNEAAKDYKPAFNAVIDMLNIKTIAAKAELPKPQRTDAKPCVHCGTKIVWLTSDGKSLPIAADSAQQGEKVYNPNPHIRHMFSDCNEVKKANKANKFKRPDGVTTEQQAQLFDK